MATYDQYEDLLRDPEIDLIDITLPPALHAKAAVAALRAGKHVFCEKPLALKVSECRRMSKAAGVSGRQLLVGQVLPFTPEYTWALKTVNSGKYGKLLGGNFKRIISDPLWLPNFWSAEKSGGPILDLNVHDTHFIRLLFGKPHAVTTNGRLRGDLAEFFHTQFHYPNESYVVESTCGIINQQGRPFVQGFEIHLEKATLLFEFGILGGEGRFLCEPTLLNSKGRAIHPRLSDGDSLNAFQGEIKEVVRCLRKEEESPILGCELAEDAVDLCTKQDKSLQRGRRILV